MSQIKNAMWDEILQSQNNDECAPECPSAAPLSWCKCERSVGDNVECPKHSEETRVQVNTNQEISAEKIRRLEALLGITHILYDYVDRMSAYDSEAKSALRIYQKLKDEIK